jgi:DNA-binding winged helix-turn-helix (wHTH) protein/Tol biopolymer transport system component
MSSDSPVYRFENFELDPSESSLKHSGEPVPITPKALHLLRLLAENHGHVLDKSFLLEQIWADSFVEEGNLTFNIRQLRKLLGDDAKSPGFIETVPKRGYRFIAKVETENRSSKSIPLIHPETLALSNAQTEIKRNAKWFLRPLAVPAILFVVAAATVGTYYGPLLVEPGKSKILTEPFAVGILSTDGNVTDAVLSESGDFVVYVAGGFGKPQSLWYRELATGQSREILRSPDLSIIGIGLSPDERSVFFVRLEERGGKNACLYKTNILGSVPEKLVCEIEGWFDVSSDGQKLSYVRCPYSENDYCSLYIADSNGQDEVRLVTQPSPIRISDNEFSPNGTTIAFASGQSRDGSNDRSVKLIDIASQQVSDGATQKFGELSRIGWLPDGNTLIVTALTSATEKAHFWKIDIAKTSATPITRDERKFNVVSLDSAGSKLLSTVVEPDFRLFSYSMTGTENPRDMGRGIAPRFGADGSIIAASDRTGRMGIWTFDKDGGNAKQISHGPSDNAPIMSADGSRVYFSSIRENRHEIWSVRPDGTDLKLIETEQGGFPIGMSIDGSKIFFVSGMTRSVRTVLTDGSNESELSRKPLKNPVISPDSLVVAHIERIDGIDGVTTLSTLTGASLARFPLDKELSGRHLAWSKDGRTIYMVIDREQSAGLSVWKLDIGSGKFTFLRNLPTADLGERSGFAVSPDEQFFITAQGRWKHDMVLLTGLN